MHFWEREIAYALVDQMMKLRVYSPLNQRIPIMRCVYNLLLDAVNHLSLHVLKRTQPLMKCNTDAKLHRRDVPGHMYDQHFAWVSLLYVYSMVVLWIICDCRHLTNPIATLTEQRHQAALHSRDRQCWRRDRRRSSQLLLPPARARESRYFICYLLHCNVYNVI